MKQTPERGRDLARWATALLALGGLVVAWYLVEMYIQATAGQDVGGALCGAHDAVNCEAAAMSSFSTIFGIPIALLGLCFYAAVLTLSLFDRPGVRASSQPFRPAAIATTLFGVGLLYSLFLAGVSVFDLGSLCPFCVMLYAVNGLGFAAAIYWAGEKPHHIFLAQLKRPADFLNGWTGVFAFAFGITLLMGIQVMSTSINERLADQDRVASMTAVERVDQERYRVEDAPAKGPRDAPVHIVEFSNFPCPHCGRLATVLDTISDEFGELVRVEYRHYPLPTQQSGHDAARAAYCAGEQDEFWPMHDELFANAPRHDVASLHQYARGLGLDEQEFAQCLDSDRARQRVDQDVTAGRQLGIQGTPTFFINGARVEGALPLDMMRQLVIEELQSD